MNNTPETHVPDEVKPYEMAARIYLKKTGGNPDALMPQQHPKFEGVVVHVPLWCFAARELINLSFQLTSMREAQETSAIMVPQ